MKHLKKLASLLLAMVMLLGLAATALASDPGTDPVDPGTAPQPVEGSLTGGTITITNPVVGQEYSIYQILYLESYNAETNAYSYKANSAWETWLKNSAEAYVEFNEQGYVTWVADADAAAFAKAAIAHAKANNITPDATVTPTADSPTAEFTDLDLGYYLVDSSLGTICSLDTTNPSVEIEEKNAVPSCEKKVKEDSTGAYGSMNDADINQTVEFKSIITLPKGSENIVFYDTMDAGFTPSTEGEGDNAKIAVKVYTDDTMENELAAGNYTVTETTTTATREESQPTKFEISFDQTYLNGLTDTVPLYIGYSAKVNSNAVIGGDGNLNTCKLRYGDHGDEETKYYTLESQTRTYVWGFDVLKYANNVESNVLAGAEFVLLNKTKDKVAIFDNGTFTEWVTVPGGGESWGDGVETTTDAAGKTWRKDAVMTTGDDGKLFGTTGLNGLDGDTYYLHEVKAPDGYNVLANDESVEITPQADVTNETLTWARHTKKVNNLSGSLLPETGGIGTTIFYVAGSILLVGAAVLLIVKKRMSVTK